MSWITRLNEAYDNCVNFENGPWPLSHFVKNAHIEVVIDQLGNYKSGRLKLLNGDDSPTLIPATESSAGRAGAKIAPHPLCDELGYCAADLPNINQDKYDAYIFQLEKWCISEFAHPKIKAITIYIKKKSLWGDLVKEIEFPITFKNKSGQATKLQPEKTFIRWRVEFEGNPCSGTWEDESLIEEWIKYDEKYNSNNGFCYVNGKLSRTSSNHPRFIRNSGDGAKLISSNDENGFTFRGRFIKSTQSAEVGFVATQKAHNALRWLIARQGARNGDQVVIAFAVSGKNIPQPMEDTLSFDLDDLDIVEANLDDETESVIDHSIDIGQSFAKTLSRYMAGYRAKLNPTENIIIMAVDSATPGRMGIVYYRDFFAAEYLEKIERWHNEFTWPQRISKESDGTNGKKGKTTVSWLPSAPSPYSILNAAYGDIIKSSEALKKNLYERIIPCIVEGRSFPQDLVHLAIRRASNPNSCEKWEWEKNIGVACALYRGFFNRHPNPDKRRNYSMSLETDNSSRDYLYGRLLAIAERIEEVALNVAGENRPTTAARLMQRFADRPFSTWRNIELALLPYMQRLQNSRAGFLVNRKKELDEVLGLFNTSDFTKDKALSGEFLLAYHCQRQALRNKPETDTEQN